MPNRERWHVQAPTRHRTQAAIARSQRAKYEAHQLLGRQQQQARAGELRQRQQQKVARLGDAKLQQASRYGKGRSTWSGERVKQRTFARSMPSVAVADSAFAQALLANNTADMLWQPPNGAVGCSGKGGNIRVASGRSKANLWRSRSPSDGGSSGGRSGEVTLQQADDLVAVVFLVVVRLLLRRNKPVNLLLEFAVGLFLGFVLLGQPALTEAAGKRQVTIGC